MAPFENKKTVGLLMLLSLLILSAAAALCLGSTTLTLSELIASFSDTGSRAYRIFMYVRLPRALGGLLAGSSLAVSGALLQVVLNNSLAGPNIIGVNAGAGLGTLLVMALAPYSVSLMPAASFIGALTAALMIYAIASLSGASRTTLILSGVAISSVINAASSCIKTFFPDISLSFLTFSIGSLANTTLAQLKWAAIYSCIGLIAAIFLSHDMNILALGDETARSLGLKAGLYRFILIVISAVLAGSAVSFCGLIGFVGLLVPHIARMMFGSDNRIVVPASALLGAISLLVCDLIGRTAFAPFELHVGIVLSIIGGIYFVGLILRRKGGRLNG
ncbi:MAG: iron ABC transporter permease [Clostridiaceae bacterium]|nr:iron ABC transporter permease [Clostridiaceae bacterium]